MSDELHIVVGLVDFNNGDGTTVPAYKASVMLNGNEACSAYAPNIGVYKTEKIARASAIALAQIKFFNEFLTQDIRTGGESAAPTPNS